jgi:hypothetical protein
MWSGSETTGDRNIDSQEHIFPESIGGRDKLPVGDVSNEWNTKKLSNLDRILRYGHVAMMLAYQKDPAIKGKRTNDKIVNKRRKQEKELIVGVDGKATIKRVQETENTTLTDVKFDYNDDFSRAIHKCIANVICSEHGSKYVRSHFPDLIEFVKNGANPYAWSFAVSFANPFKNLFCEPKCIKLGYFTDENNKENILVVVCFIHSSGIWLAASKPNFLTVRIIEQFSKSILEDSPLVKQIEGEGNDFKSLYGMNWVSSRKYIGELKFLWFKKQIEGNTNPEDLFYLLTKCWLCGQINPTGIMVNKDFFLVRKQVPMVAMTDCHLFDLSPQYMEYKADDQPIRFIRMPKNSWNRYSLSDLRKKGFKVEKWEKEKLQCYIDTQGIEIPEELDVRKLSIHNSTCQCLNCGNMIKFSAMDCFL